MGAAGFWYTTAVDGIRDLLTDFALAGAAVFFAAWLLLIGGRWFTRKLAAIRPYLAALLVFTFVAMNYAQKSGTNEPPRGASNVREESFDGRVSTYAEATVDKEHVERGEGPNGPMRSAGPNTQAPLSRLESETTNETYSYAMPVNATRYEKWWRRGAYEDVFELDLDGLLFPFGEYLCDSLWVYSWGMAGRSLADASNRVVATGVPMSAVPGVSRFWSAEAADGGRLLTWENFFLNRDTNTPVSAQLELRPSGDYIARSNLVERLYRRVNPDDWDDDGIPNDDDLDPYFYDGDNFGLHQELPQGANSNAYCWVDLVVPNANALVTFIGDGPSALPDPAFIAKAGETNRVTLLIGKTYQVTSRMPISCIDQSSGDIEVYQISPTELQIVWPVEIEASSMRSGSSFSMSVWPDWLGGTFTWTNSCCAVLSSGGWSYSYTCAENCLCTGCSANGYYGYEAYRLPAYGGSCGCSSHGELEGGGDDDDPPSVGVSVSFSKDAVIFEDTYETSPEVFVQKRSTTVKLKVSAFGGPNGGTVSFTTTNLGKLAPLACGPLLLPSSLVLGPYGTYTEEFTCEGASASGTANDVVVSGSFVENVTGESYDAQDQITVFRVLLTPFRHAKSNICDGRHKYGVREKVVYSQLPASPALSWRGNSGGYRDNEGRYVCPILQANNPIQLAFGNTEYSPVMAVVEPFAIEVIDVDAHKYSVPIGEAGGIGMDFELALKPLDVRFSEIMVEEVPCYSGSRSGYFEHPAFASLQSHTRANGAGRWMRPDANNAYSLDHVCITSNIPRITPEGVLTNDAQFGWTHGEIFWEVPSGWGELNSVELDPPEGVLHERATHIAVLFEDGTCGVRKFHHQVTRTTNDVVVLDGEVK